MLGNDLFSSGNNLLLPALKMQWTVSDKPVSAFTASTPPGLQQIWAHPGMLWGGSFAMCSWTPSTVWCKSPGAVTAALPLHLCRGKCVSLSVPGHLWRAAPGMCWGGGRGLHTAPGAIRAAAIQVQLQPAVTEQCPCQKAGWKLTVGMGIRAGRAGENELSLNSLRWSPFSWPISTPPVAGACGQHTGIPTKCPYLLHTAHCSLPIHCVSRCTRNPVAFLAHFCFQQYSLQGWCIHNEFRNSGHGITAPGSAGKERLLQHTAVRANRLWDSTAGNAGSGKKFLKYKYLVKGNRIFS